MSENRKKPSGRLHFYGNGALIDWLKKGYLPLSSGVSVAEPFIRHDQWSQSAEPPLDPEALERQWQLYYEALPETVRGLLSFEHFRQQGGTIEAEVRDAARRQNQPQQQGYDHAWLGQARYLRLFPSAACFLAWQELGDAFSGLAIELDSGHVGLESSRERPTVLAPVVYGGPYRANVTATNPFPGLLEDHPARQDNQEWRLLMLAKKVKTIDAVPVLPIPRGLVAGIFWSSNTAQEIIDSVRTLASQDMRFRGIQLGQVVPDERAWQLRLVRD
ncbi:MAG: hypothetical protein LAT65_10925 [Saccharospirillum sp.]|nr:hypothetical protein [Saccharospirillum sp.]